MPRNVLRRFAPLALMVVVGFLPVLDTQPAYAQRSLPDLLKPIRITSNPTTDQRTRFGEMKAGEVVLNPPAESDKVVLKEMAKQYLYKVTHHEFYTTPDTGELKPPAADFTIASVTSQLRSTLLFPTANPPLKPAQLEYVREYGAALDEQLWAIVKSCTSKDHAIVRVNAARIFAMLCETGAPAHWKSAIEYLKSKNPNPEVYYYVLKGAEVLMAGFDPLRPNWVTRDTYYELAVTLDGLILKGMPILDKVAKDEPTTTALVSDPNIKVSNQPLTAGQIRAVQMYRTQAIRALGQAKTDEIKTADDKTVRPTLTLARIAVGDPTISPPPSDKESAEAVIGLLNATAGPSLNVDVVIDAIAVGVSRGYKAKSEDVKDVSHQWKVTAARMSAALDNWKGAGTVRVRAPATKTAIAGLSELLKTSVLTPIQTQKDDSPMPAFALTKVEDWAAERAKLRSPTVDLFSDPAVKMTFPTR